MQNVVSWKTRMNFVILVIDLNLFSMKKFSVLIFCMLITQASFGQSKSNNYLLKLDFAPSFMSSSELTIEGKGDSAFLNIQISKNDYAKEASMESKAVIRADRLTKFTDFIKTYKFQIKSNIDTIGAHKEFIHGDSVVVYEISGGNDGIDVKGVLNQNGLARKFAFWSPNKGTKNAELMDILFAITDSAFTDQKIVDYME